MQIVDRELGGVIYATSSESLADVILPLLDEWDVTKNSYKCSLNDDGDYLYVMFENCIFEDMWRMATIRKLWGHIALYPNGSIGFGCNTREEEVIGS